MKEVGVMFAARRSSIAPAVPSLCRELLHLHIMQSVVNVLVCYSVPAK